MLRRDHTLVNLKRVERIYREAGLTLPRKRKKRRRGTAAEPRPFSAGRPNEVWICDFVHDRTEYGRRLKIVTVVDEYTRECLEIRVEKRMTSLDVMETFDELFSERWAPAHIRSDNGPEFIAKKLDTWLQEQGAYLVHIKPGSPWENGYIESFNGKLRDECLEEEMFWSRGEAQVVVDWWRDVYSQERPRRLPAVPGLQWGIAPWDTRRRPNLRRLLTSMEVSTEAVFSSSISQGQTSDALH